jgi:hypothetical protein
LIGDGTSKVSNLNYSFTVSDSWFGAEMYALSLEFEKGDFKTLSGVYNYDPSGWGRLATLGTASSSYLLSFAFDPSTTIGVRETLSFAVDAIMFNSAFSDPSVWRQSWLALDTKGGETAALLHPVLSLLPCCFMEPVWPFLGFSGENM